MTRLLPLLLLILVPAPSAALADGCPPSTCGTTSSSMPGSSVLFVRPYGAEGPLRAFDLKRGSRRFSLPRGALSADGRAFVAAAVAAKEARTTVARYDAETGRLLRGWSLRGSWQIGGVTADGSTFVLTRHTHSATTVRVGAEQHVLRGWVEVEAFSPNGRRLYLVHWGRNRYVLQQLDVASGRLAPTRLADPDEKMSGLPATAVATRDGHWLLTLYWGGENGEDFIHALDLRSGVAHCIDLPLTGEFFELGTSSLTLSPDEKTLYLASPYLGRLTTIDIDELEVRRVVPFRGLPSSSMNLSVGPSAAVTPNGRMLAFSGGRTVWLYDTAYRTVKRVAKLHSAAIGLGFTPDGRRLLALQRLEGPVFLDAATGRRAG